MFHEDKNYLIILNKCTQKHDEGWSKFVVSVQGILIESLSFY